MNYREMLAASFRSSRMTNKKFKLEDLFSRFYEYEAAAESANAIFSWTIHLMAAGSGSISMPFGARFQLENAVLVIATEGGEVRLSGGNGRFSVSEGSILVYPCSGAFSLNPVIIPWSYHIYFLTGGGLSLYLPFLQTPQFFASSRFPRIGLYEERMEILPETVAIPSLLKMHRFLTDILTAFCMEMLPKPEENTQHLPLYLRAMHDFVLHHSEETFSLGAFEEQFQISRYRLCREYSKAYGISPLKDFNRIRIEKAKKNAADFRPAGAGSQQHERF